MRYWIARFSFTFMVIGGFLFYQVYKLQTSDQPVAHWQALLMVVGGALAVSLGFQGIRQRHRQLRETNRD